MTTTKSQSNKKGFTLLELLAVMGIMLILATIAVTSYRSMVTGAGITSSLGHLRQSLGLARQQAIMQGKNAYIVFYQDTNESWYVTCLSEGTKTKSAARTFILDEYRLEGGYVAQGSTLYNLSDDKATFSEVTDAQYNDQQLAYEIITKKAIWDVGDRYGWEVSQRIKLPRGFKFVENPPSVVRFKPDGTAANVDGNTVGGGQKISIVEETRPTHEYSVKVNMNGSVEVMY